MEEGCSHIKGEDLDKCPFECKTWLNPFPGTCSNARFENDSITDFIELVKNTSGVKQVFKSLDLIFDQTLYKLTEAAKTTTGENEWKVKLLETLTNIKSLPSLNAEELDLFKKLMADKLLDNIQDIKNRIIPNVLILTRNEDESFNIKLIYNAYNKKRRPLNFQDFALIHKTFIDLKSIRIDSLNMQISGDETIIVPNNDLELIHINLVDKIENPSSLVIFLFQSYHWTVKDFKLEIEDGKIKQEEMIDDGKRIESSFGEITFQFEYLKSLEINNFYKSINTPILLSKLGTTACKLKKLSLLGQIDSDKVFYYAVKDHCYSLTSLTVSAYQYSPINILSRLTSLENFSYRWDSLDESVDIFKILTTLPKLKQLELGYIRNQGDWIKSVTNSETYHHLTDLSLYHVNIEEDSFKSIYKQLPNLKNILLNGCRIGKNKQISESTIDFGEYNLDTLVLENCKLFHAKKDLKAKGRAISRFFLSMHYHEPYATKIKHKFGNDSSKSKLYIEKEYFVYDVADNFPALSNTNIVYIKANLIRSFSLSKNSTEYVTFCPESEIDNTVEDGDPELMNETDDEAEAEMEAETEMEADAEMEAEMEAQAEIEAEIEAVEAEMEAEAEVAAEAEMEAELAAEPELIAESEPDFDEELDAAILEEIAAETQAKNIPEIFDIDDSEDEKQDDGMNDIDDEYNITMEDISMIDGIEVSETVATTKANNKVEVTETIEVIEKTSIPSPIEVVVEPIEVEQVLDKEGDLSDILVSNNEDVTAEEENMQDIVANDEAEITVETTEIFNISDNDEEETIKESQQTENVEDSQSIKKKCLEPRLFSSSDEEESLPDIPDQDTNVNDEVESLPAEPQPLDDEELLPVEPQPIDNGLPDDEGSLPDMPQYGDDEESLPDIVERIENFINDAVESNQEETEQSDSSLENEEDLQLPESDVSDEHDLTYSDDEGIGPIKVDTFGTDDEDYEEASESGSEVNLRRSTRKKLPVTRSMKISSRKRAKYSDDEEDSNDVISQFIENCQKYDAIIRLPSGKRSKLSS